MGNVKTSAVMDFIAGMKVGDKVSVRGLASGLGVSEGTAYKCIKLAETQGLVRTKPKVGTVRINGNDETGEMSLGLAARQLGAVCVCGAARADSLPLPPVVLADGSVEQLRSALERNEGNALCFIGDRPELQQMAMDMGADLMLTGRTYPSHKLLITAESMDRCIFVSEQESSAIISRLNRKLERGLPQREMSEVRDWMQLPRYLYYDDMMTEWNRLYKKLFADGTVCAVVNDRLKICGSIDGITAMGAAPDRQLSELMDSAQNLCVVNESTTMTELADQMINGGKLFAFVTDKEGMTGFISADDVMRYYKYSRQDAKSGESVKYDGAHIELIPENSDLQRRVYTTFVRHTTGDFISGKRAGLIFQAGAMHAELLLGGPVDCESGTFYTPSPLQEDGEYMISSELAKRTETGTVMELEMFNEYASYAKCMMTFALKKSDADGGPDAGPQED